jgi:hypothetical protein
MCTTTHTGRRATTISVTTRRGERVTTLAGNRHEIPLKTTRQMITSRAHTKKGRRNDSNQPNHTLYHQEATQFKIQRTQISYLNERGGGGGASVVHAIHSHTHTHTKSTKTREKHRKRTAATHRTNDHRLLPSAKPDALDAAADGGEPINHMLNPAGGSNICARKGEIFFKFFLK